MKIAIHSDLHREFWEFSPEFLSDKNFDILVLAGDISISTDIDLTLQEIRRLTDKPILYIPGNHDFYGSSIQSSLPYFEKVCKKHNIEFMYRRTYNFNGYKFICVTGWSTMDSVSGYEDFSNSWSIVSMIADFWRIRKHSVRDMVAEGKDDLEFIKHTIDDKSIIVSHFCPLLDGFNGHFPIGILSNYFHNNRMEIFDDYAKHKPLAWIYGHTHLNASKVINGVPVVSNQRGYPKENEKGYNRNYIIEL